jgi:dienelactone hydrolase
MDKMDSPSGMIREDQILSGLSCRRCPQDHQAMTRKFQLSMTRRKILSFLMGALALITPCLAGEKPARAKYDGSPGKPYVYKTSAGKERKMEIYFPPGHDPGKAKVPGMILFHGGGWRGGDLSQFRATCEYFASRGLVCATVGYQLPDKGAVEAMPEGQSFKRLCIIDAKSAIRWFKANAAELGIDPARIITGGGSAGGHISALATHAPDLNDPADPKDIDTRVVAYLWFNPAFSPEDRKDPAIDILAVMKPELSPAIVFFGDKDPWLKGWIAARDKWKSLGVENIDERTAVGENHGFFNQPTWRTVTLIAADEFLVKQGLLDGGATLKAPSSGESLRPSP